MIESIIIRNFRLHKKLTIEFDPQVTTIIGKSYAGKSTIIRALKWACLNRPPGMSVIRWGSKYAKAILKVDGHKITRYRGKGNNLYNLDEKKLAAFGNDVPSCIAKLLNVNENNFQGQHSLPFWFGETAGEVSRKLNGIVNLSVIATTLSTVNSMLNKAKARVDISKERLAETKRKKKELAFVDEMVGDWSKVQKLNALYEAKHARVMDLKIMLDRCEKYQTTLQHMKPPSLKPLTIAYEKLTEAEESYTALELILDSLCNTKEKAERLNKNAARLEKELKKATGKRCPLCGRKNT
jgi:DNA repair ATPase RecN